MPDKAILLDRDNTLIEDPGFINHPDQVKLLDGVAEALTKFRAMGYKLIVISNQSGVARGVVSEKTLGQIHERLRELLAQKGAQLDRIYYCPYHPDGVIGKYRKQSRLRKPDPGMLLAAAEEMNINLIQSWMIGDSACDIEAGSRAGCKTILLDNPLHTTTLQPNQTKPDYRAVNITEAVNIVKKYNRSPAKSTAKTQPARQSSQQPEQPESAQIRAAPAEEIDSQSTEQLLSGILEQLKGMRRSEMFSEFSMLRLIAGIVQTIVLFCLLISIWLLMSPTRQDNAVLISLGFAVVFQIMALTFYIIQPRK